MSARMMSRCGFFALFASALFANGLSAQDQPLSHNAMFTPDRVVDVVIELGGDDWDTIRRQTRSFTRSLAKQPAESPFSYVKGNVTIDGRRIEDVGIRKKGFLGSLNDQRPSLKIKFSEYKEQSPMVGLERLTLNNNHQDPSRICQYLTYKMFREAGTVAPRCGFARVTVNGEYLGIYSNVESIKRPFLERGFGDGSGDYFEGTVADFFDGFLQRIEKKNKKADLAPIERLTKLLQVEPDETDLAQIEELIDIEAFLRYWAMESIVGFWDSYCSNQNNFFMYVSPENGKLYFIPWGTDSAFSKTTPLPPYRIRPRSVHAKAILPNRLYRIPEIQQRYREVFMDLLDRVWVEDDLMAEIDRLQALLSPYKAEENEDFEKTMKKFRSFVKSRRTNLMKEFKDGMPKLRTEPKQPVYFRSAGNVTMRFATQWYDKTPKDTKNLGELDIELEWNGELVELENVGVFSERSKWPSPAKVKPPTIVVIGYRKSDGKKITIGVGFEGDRFEQRDTPVDIGGVFFSGNILTAFTKMKMVGGTATLSKSGTEQGAAVEGTMEARIIEMVDGSEPDD